MDNGQANELEDDGSLTMYSSPPVSPAAWKAEVNADSVGDRLRKDFNKRRWDLFPFDAAEEVVKVLEFGATKYEPRGWEAGMDWHRCYNSMLRHLFAWFAGEDLDKETGISHMSHAACNALFLVAYEKRGVGQDTRPMTDD